MGKPLINLRGQRFGKLVVIGYAGSEPRSMWNCLCDCGNAIIAQGNNLRSGNSKSCGCDKNLATHGHTIGRQFTSAYSRWHSMIQRCTNPNNTRWQDYGGRGITVDPRWYKFENFLADMGEPPPGLTLDRKDNDLGYSKGNCRWATRVEQRNNQRQP